jgi:gluconolactonase
VTGIYEIVDQRFADLIDPVAFLEPISDGNRWAEGPVWFADLRCLIWSDIPNDRMRRWDETSGVVSDFRVGHRNPNGGTRDRQGRLITAEQGERVVSRTEWDGSVTVLASEFDGARLNSPNDVVVHSDGSVWFTDPNYGIISDYVGTKAPQEQPGCRVYRLDPDSGELAVVIDDMVMPNGLAFSADESRLYVSDSGWLTDPAAPHHIRVFDVSPDGVVSGGEVFAEVSPGIPDGIRVDAEGNVWSSAADGVHCYAPDGTLLGKILVPEAVANLTFGGAKRNRLFITATTSVYAVFLNVRGIQRP